VELSSNSIEYVPSGVSSVKNRGADVAVSADVVVSRSVSVVMVVVAMSLVVVVPSSAGSAD
jgi:hypothetical protein